MLKNYFKVAWRNLFRNKAFALTNILGLTIGITCIILICLWMQDELTYNKFHTKYDHIYQVQAHRDFNNQIFTDPNMVLPLAKTIQAEIPEVKNAVVTTHRNAHVLRYGDKMLKEQGYTVSDHFFDMFTWNFKWGNAKNAIQDAYSIVLTESTARAFFGNEDPLNKIIKVDNDYDAKVTAVVADPPGNSTFQFDFINTFNYDNDFLKRAMTNWQNSSWDVFIETNKGANIAAIDKKINAIKVLHDPGDKKISKYFSFPMNQWRLYADFKDGKNAGGLIKYVRLFSTIALIVLLIACVNFMNLSTARAEKRAKEVGVRKTLGSGKLQLTFQFFCESIILASLSYFLSIAAVILLLPSFNLLVDKHLTLDFSQPLFWAGSVALVLITGLIAGSYPALYLSSFNPVKVLKGTFLPGKAAVLPRRILVVSQFVISILLISATIIVYLQIQHIKNREMGYNPNNLLMIPSSPDTQKNYEVIKQELLQSGQINSVVRTFSPITDIWWKTPAPDWQGKPANLNILFAGMSTDVGFTKSMGIKMLDGKDFTGVPSDSGAMLLNKAAVEAMGFKNPVGTKVRYGNEYTIIGVTDNVIMASPFQPVDPMMVFFDPNNANYINIRLNSSAHLQAAIQTIEKVFKKYNPANPFEYKFVDQEFNRKFLTEELISKLTTIFAGLAIFICCIGLAGLASFTIEKRIREIGIRKVLGASVQSLLIMISKEFLKLVLVAFVIAVPAAWYLLHSWLQNYDYRVNISFWIFGIVGVIILSLTLVVVIMNTATAALKSPVKSLRAE